MASPSIALVALRSPTLPDPDAVAADCGRLAGPAPSVTSRTDSSFTLAWEGATANVTLVDRPIPWERLEGPCATAWYWPDAERDLRGHSAHLFLTLLDESRRAIDTSFRLTRLAVAAAAAAPAEGIVWGASGAVHRPVDFAQLAGESTTTDLPLNLWIDFRVVELDSPEGFSLFTTGMEGLGRRELEVPRYAGDPQRLVAAAYNIAHYVLEKDAPLKDSEVIGLPDGSQVTVREDHSMIDPAVEVFRLEFE